MEESQYHAKLSQIAKRKSVKALFKKMSGESKAHEMILKWVFARLFPGEESVKVEVPPLEVYPFYPKFESVGDYLTALEYCMESELFAKHTYELLFSVARNDEARRVAGGLPPLSRGTMRR